MELLLDVIRAKEGAFRAKVTENILKYPAWSGRVHGRVISPDNRAVYGR
jgi:hypothetical protein